MDFDDGGCAKINPLMVSQLANCFDSRKGLLMVKRQKFKTKHQQIFDRKQSAIDANVGKIA